MSGMELRDTIFALSRESGLGIPSTERLARTERASAKLALWRGGSRRVRVPRRATGPRPRDVRRAIDAIWADPAQAAAAAQLVMQALAARRRTYDRALIHAFLRHYPVDHPAFAILAVAAGAAAERHDWPWRERGRRYALWDAEKGPARLGEALRTDPEGAIRDAGFEGLLANARFLAAARTVV